MRVEIVYLGKLQGEKYRIIHHGAVCDLNLSRSLLPPPPLALNQVLSH